MGAESAEVKTASTIFGVGVSTAIGTLSSVVSLSLVGFNIASSIKDNYDNKAEYSEELYRMLDEMDRITNLYDTAEQREELLNDALAVIGDKNLDPTDVLSDLGGLMATGDFESNEEALMFDATLREFLHINGKNIEQVNTGEEAIVIAC